MEAQLYVKDAIRPPYATETPQSAHILALPIIHITFPIGTTIDQAIENATATTELLSLARERQYIANNIQDPNYKGARPVDTTLVGRIKLADDRLRTEQDKEQRDELMQQRSVALAQIVTEFHDYFNTQGQ